MQITRSIVLLFVALVMVATSATSFGQVSVSITVGPPVLPVYEQPVCPGDGYIWTPGYWAYGDDGYYWVPGTWVEPPEVGLLWTPGYWSWNGAVFVFNEGYWGPQVGFYGGISYGFGYFGRGYEGGRWDNGHFFYNRAVTNVDVTVIHNVYNTTVVNNNNVRVSYNGGNGGINAHPTAAEEAAVHEKHVPPVAAQVQHVQAARSNPELRAAANHGKPPIAATPKPGAFHDRAAIPANEAGGGDNHATNRAGVPPHASEPATPEHNVARGAGAVHPNELPPTERPAPSSTGNPKQDKKYQQEQEKLNAKQEQERQQLQQNQEQDHQRLAQQKADDGKRQGLEQKHQQQTQQLQEKHAAQQQQLQEKQQRANRNQSKPPKDKS